MSMYMNLGRLHNDRSSTQEGPPKKIQSYSQANNSNFDNYFLKSNNSSKNIQNLNSKLEKPKLEKSFQRNITKNCPAHQTQQNQSKLNLYKSLQKEITIKPPCKVNLLKNDDYLLHEQVKILKNVKVPFTTNSQHKDQTYSNQHFLKKINRMEEEAKLKEKFKQTDDYQKKNTAGENKTSVIQFKKVDEENKRKYQDDLKRKSDAQNQRIKQNERKSKFQLSEKKKENDEKERLLNLKIKQENERNERLKGIEHRDGNNKSYRNYTVEKREVGSKELLSNKLKNEATTKSSVYATNDYNNCQREGLPNLGNTCFLNSALQLLYSATQFRQAILTYSGGVKLLHTLKDIFLAILQGLTQQVKANLLHNLAYLLKELHGNYVNQSQQDSHDFLMLLVISVGDYTPSLIRCFQNQYFSICDCKDTNNYVTVGLNLPIARSFCTACKRTEKILFQKSPKYLIGIGGERAEDKTEISFQQKMKNSTIDVRYTICSKIIYLGSGRSGHYLACRNNENNIWSCFNDSKVFEEKYLRTSYGKITVFLYEKVEDFEVQSKSCIGQIKSNLKLSEIQESEEKQPQPVHSMIETISTNSKRQIQNLLIAPQLRQPSEIIQLKKIIQVSDKKYIFSSYLYGLDKFDGQNLSVSLKPIKVNFQLDFQKKFDNRIQSVDVIILNDFNFFYLEKQRITLQIEKMHDKKLNLENILVLLEKQLMMRVFLHIQYFETKDQLLNVNRLNFLAGRKQVNHRDFKNIKFR